MKWLGATLIVIFAAVVIFACGGGGGSDSSGDDEDSLGIIPLIPHVYYVSYEETQPPDTTPGTTVRMVFSTNNELFEGSYWEGTMTISGSYGGGGPIDMYSAISFGFPLPLQPSDNLKTGILPFTLKGTWTPAPGATFTVTQDIELVCFLDTIQEEMQIMVFVNQGTQCFPGSGCKPFAALGPIDAEVPIVERIETLSLTR